MKITTVDTYLLRLSLSPESDSQYKRKQKRKNKNSLNERIDVSWTKNIQWTEGD